MSAATDYLGRRPQRVNLLRRETAERHLAPGHPPVMLPSHPLAGTHTAHVAEEQLEACSEGYCRSLAHLNP